MENRTTWTDEIVGELESAYRDGLNTSQACWQVGIARNFYYDRYNTDTLFKDKMDKARQYLSKIARIKVAGAITKGDMKTARWYLEKRDKDDFSSRTELTGRGGKPLGAGISPEEKERLDKIILRKHGNETTTNEGPAGDDQRDDQPSGGTESEGVS